MKISEVSLVAMAVILAAVSAPVLAGATGNHGDKDKGQHEQRDDCVDTSIRVHPDKHSDDAMDIQGRPVKGEDKGQDKHKGYKHWDKDCETKPRPKPDTPKPEKPSKPERPTKPTPSPTPQPSPTPTPQHIPVPVQHNTNQASIESWGK